MKIRSRFWISTGVASVLLVWVVVFILLSFQFGASQQQPAPLPTLVGMDTSIGDSGHEVDTTDFPTIAPTEPVPDDTSSSDSTSDITGESPPPQAFDQNTRDVLPLNDFSTPETVIADAIIPGQFVAQIDPGTTRPQLRSYTATHGIELANYLPQINRAVFRIPATMQSLPDADFVVNVEPDYAVSALSIPNDQGFANQWYLDVINVPDSWDLLPVTPTPVTVAVIDSGVCFGEQDMRDRLLTSGWDYIDSDNLPQDEFGHGCGVSAVLAANMDNRIGIAGIAPHIDILPLRVLDATGNGSYANVAEALIYATDMGADIANLSLGGSQPSSILQDAIAYAHQNGTMIIAAAGNSGSNSPVYPAAYDHVIAVGAVDQSLNRASFSNHGSWVDLWAPGTDIYTLGLGGATRMAGTSLAAPQVAGVAAFEMALGRQLVVDGGIVAVQDSTEISTPEPQDNPDSTPICDLRAVEVARDALFDLVDQSESNPGSVTESELYAAQQAYAAVVQPCYDIDAEDGYIIDNGGYTSNHDAHEEDASAQFVAFGTKWGLNSPFAAGQPPASTGGTVTYSFMPSGTRVIEQEGAPEVTARSVSSIPVTDATCDLEASTHAVFQQWQDVANINFEYVEDNGADFNAPDGNIGHIRIGFIPIDQPGQELAHAYYPGPDPTDPDATGVGNILLDFNEIWGCTTQSTTGAGGRVIISQFDYDVVLLHEIGHAIGLRHQQEPTQAVMNAFYNQNADSLAPDDILGAQQIYGASSVPVVNILEPQFAFANTFDQYLLRWETTPDTARYEFQLTVQSDVNFVHPIVSKFIEPPTTAGDILEETTPQLRNGEYRWRVRVISTSREAGAWSDPSNAYSTFVVSADVPALLTPINGLVVKTDTPEFNWTQARDAITYNLQISDTPDFDNLHPASTQLDTISTIPATSLSDGLYFWRVQAIRADGAGEWSEIWQFEIDAAAPLLSDPAVCPPNADGVPVCSASQLLLEWSPVDGAVEYQLHLDTAPNFTGMLFMDQLFMDQLFMDQLFMDQLFMDQLFMDQLFMDQLFMDQLFMDQLFMDQLFMDQLFMDQLFMDQLFMDQLFMDQLFMDQLFMDQLFMDQLVVNKITGTSWLGDDFAEGVHYWRVRAYREDGTFSAWSEPGTFIIDTDRNDIVINEIFPGNPDEGDAAWVEITNARPRGIGATANLDGWEFVTYDPNSLETFSYLFDANDPQVQSNPGLLILEPGEYLLLLAEDFPLTSEPQPNTLYTGAGSISWPLDSVTGLSTPALATNQTLSSTSLDLSAYTDAQIMPVSQNQPIAVDDANTSTQEDTGTPVETEASVNSLSVTAHSDVSALNFEYTVTTTAPTSDGVCDADCSLIDAIDAANADGDHLSLSIINLQDSATYTLTEINNVIDGGTGLPVISSKIIINGNGSTITRAVEAPVFRLFWVNGFGDLTLNNVTVSNGVENLGGAVYVVGGNLTANNSIFTGNNATNEAGAIYLLGSGTVTIESSTIRNNTAETYAGAIESLGGSTLTISNSLLQSNTAQSNTGGAIYSEASTLNIIGSVFDGNQAASAGGAVDTELGNTTTISNTTFFQNSTTSDSSGGGAYGNADSTFTITNSLFDSNTTNQTGGAIYNYQLTGTAIGTITNTTFHNNVAGSIGGAIATQDTTEPLNITNSTFVDNNSFLFGSTLQIAGFSGGIINLKNSFISSASPSVPQCNLNFGSINSIGTNFVTDSSCAGYDSNFIEVTPAELDLDALGDNGGVTQTIAISESSVAADSATDCILIDGDTTLRTDQRGYVRPASGCDVGAFELEGVAPLTYICNPSDVTVQECEALVTLYNTTGGTNWTNADNWFTTNAVCTWHGVICGENSVTTLVLNDNNLSGIIPPEIANLTNLVQLVLQDNLLAGSIPPEMGTLGNLQDLALFNNVLTGSLPPELSTLTNLGTFSVANNNLSGSIPTEYGELVNLTILQLFNNNLSGEIPASLTNLTNLTRLELGSNQLEGTLPSGLEALSSLTNLGFSQNLLSGTIPPELGSLPDLTTLTLYRNQLSGTIPPELGNLPNLATLALSHNALSGEIPQELTNLNSTTLSILDLSYNALTSSNDTVLDFLNTEDPDWADTQTIAPANLQVDVIDDTSLNVSWDAIPYTADGGYYNVGYKETFDEFSAYIILEQTADKSTTSAQLTGLNPGTSYDVVVRTFTPAHDIQQNDLTSDWSTPFTIATSGASYVCNPTDVSITECEALVDLYNSTDGDNWTNNTNWLQTDEICTWNGVSCVANSVNVLSLPANNLAGNLPASIGDLANLEVLVLYSNSLGGTMPASIGDLTNLRFLNLSSNSMSGNILLELSTLADLQSIQLNGNPTGGTIPAQIGNLSNLTDLNLDTTSLTGEIPATLGNLSNLTDLKLDNNTFTGGIPPEFGNLSSLQLLGLSNSNLSGEIPATLGNLSNLTNLVLANNSLTGSIPPELGNLNNLSILFLQRNQLSGAIPPELGNLSTLQSLYLNDNQLSGEIPLEITNLNSTTLSILDLSYNALTSSNDTVRDFLSTEDPDWADTQTIAPSNLTLANITETSVDVGWDAIPYTADGGYYEVGVATEPGGSYSIQGTTTANKLDTNYTVTNLAPGQTYYFAVRTFTPAHGVQQNALTSDWSSNIALSLGAVYNVNTTDMTDDGVCDALSCTLIEAINAANADSQDSIINLQEDALYILTDVLDSSQGDSGLPAITTPVIIEGQNATIAKDVIEGTPDFRLMIVQATGNLTLNDVTMRNGYLNNAFTNFGGGAILNLGTLTIDNATFENNTVANDAGGAIANYNTARVDNTDFTSNGANGGGAILNQTTATMTITGSTFNGNTSNTTGGAIANAGNLTIDNTSFDDNFATDIGGAIENRVGGTLIFNNSTFTGNTGLRGGAIANASVTEISRSTLDSNVSNSNGGAIFSDAGSVTISDSTLEFNTAFGNGGAIDVTLSGGSLTIIRSTISGNSSDTSGGGIGIGVGSQASIDKSIIRGNFAGQSAGGIYSGGSPVTITNSEISGNNVDTLNGGGIESLSTDLTIVNTTISGNSAANGSAIAVIEGSASLTHVTMSNNFAEIAQLSSISPSTVTVKNSIVNDTFGIVACDTETPLTSLGTNFATDNTCAGFTQTTNESLDLQPLADNGGLTRTQAITDTSIAFDAATDCTLADGTTPLSEDQRGAQRPQGDACDAGAYEYTAVSRPQTGTRGGAAALIAPASTQSVDFVRFGNGNFNDPTGSAFTGGTVGLPLDARRSIGRDPVSSDTDHRTDWLSQRTTAGGQNLLKLHINEIYTGTPDVIELYNPTIHFVDASGWVINIYNETGTLTASHTFDTGTIIDPAMYVVLVTGNPGDVVINNPDAMVIPLDNSLGWSTNNAAGVVELNNGVSGVDFVRFGTELAPSDPANFSVTAIEPKQGDRWIIPDALAPQPGQSIGRDNRSVDTDRGLDWIQQIVTLGEQNVALRPAINDDIFNAIPIPFVPFRDVRNTTTAATGDNEPVIPLECSGDVLTGHTVWYELTVTPDNEGTYTFQTDESNYDTVLAVYGDDALIPGQAATPIACDDDSGDRNQSRLTIDNLQPGVYYIVAAGKNGRSGDLVFSVQPPANDDFDNAIPVPVDESNPSFSDSQVTIAASRAADDPLTCGVIPGRSVWYTFTAPDDVRVRFFTEGTDFDTVISVYAGDRSNLYGVGCNDNTLRSGTSSIDFQPVAGRTYHIMVSGNYGTGGNLEFQAERLIPPPNDDFENAFDIGSLNDTYQLTQNTVGATTQALDPVPTEGLLPGRSVWYQYTPRTTARVVLTTATSNYDTILSVWALTDNGLQHVASNDNQGTGTETSQIVLDSNDLVPGMTYYILVNGYINAGGILTFSAFQPDATPDNDLLQNAYLITGASSSMLEDGGAPYSFDQDTTGATISQDELIAETCVPDTRAFNNSVWYRYDVSDLEQTLRFSTEGSLYDTVLAVWTEQRGADGNIITDNLGQPLFENIACESTNVAGTSETLMRSGRNLTLYIQVASFLPGGGLLHFEANALPLPPSNDDFATPVIIPDLTNLPPDPSSLTDGTIIDEAFIHTGNTIVASTDFADPNPGCALTVGESIWYQYTQTGDDGTLGDNIVMLDTEGSQFDTVLSVWELTDNGIFNQMACSNDANRDGTSALEFAPVPGETYYIMLAGQDGANGDFNFRARLRRPPVNDDYVNATILNLSPTASGLMTTTVSTSTTGATTEIQDLACNSAVRRTVWYNYTAGASPETLSLSTQGSAFNTVLGVFSNHETPVDCTGNETIRNIELNAGQTIYIMVGGAFGETGNLQLTVNAAPAPDNDERTGAFAITSPVYSTEQNIIGATENTTDPATCNLNITQTQTVWYEYTASETANITLSLEGTDFQPLMSVYSVGTSGELLPIGCSTGGDIDLEAQAGTTYMVMMGRIDGAGNTLRLSMTEAMRPVNDDFANAIDVTLPFTETVNTIAATDEITDPDTCLSSSGQSVWYAYIADGFGTITINVTGHPATIAVYTGTINNLTSVGCITGTDPLSTSLTIPVQQGTTYYIMLADPNAVGGDYTVSIDGDITEQPPSISMTLASDTLSVNEPSGTVNFTAAITNDSLAQVVRINSIADAMANDMTALCGAPADLAPAQTLTCNFSQIFTGQAGTTFPVAITATGMATSGDVLTASAGLTITVNDIPSSIAVTKVPDVTSVDAPGANVGFIATVTNTSTADIVTITSVTDSSFGDISATCTPALPASLVPGASLTCDFAGFVDDTQGIIHTNTIIATGIDDDGVTVTGQASADVTVNCRNPNPKRDLSYTFDGATGTATITNPTTTCVFDVGLASYIALSRGRNGYQLSQSSTANLFPGETATLTVDVPQCMTEVVLFEGAVQADSRDYRGSRLERDTLNRKLGLCAIDTAGGVFASGIPVDEPTSVPATQAPVTAVPAQVTEEVVVLEAPAPSATLVLYQNGLWRFRSMLDESAPETLVTFGIQETGWQALTGDWNGDGQDGLALYKDGLWVLRDTAQADQFVSFGTGGQALAGDWNGDGVDDLALFNAGTWQLRDTVSGQVTSLILGENIAAAQAIAGDWNADGRDTVGLYSNGQWLILMDHNNPQSIQSIAFGTSSSDWLAVTGDWNLSGDDTIGLFNTGIWRVRNNNLDNMHDIAASFGNDSTGWQAVGTSNLTANMLTALSGDVTLPELTPAITETQEPVATQATPDVQPETTQEIAPATEATVVTPLPEVTEDVETVVQEPVITKTTPAPAETQATEATAEPLVTEKTQETVVTEATDAQADSVPVVTEETVAPPVQVTEAPVKASVETEEAPTPLPDRLEICHVTSNGNANHVLLHLPNEALSSHFDDNLNPLAGHENDFIIDETHPASDCQ